MQREQWSLQPADGDVGQLMCPEFGQECRHYWGNIEFSATSMDNSGANIEFFFFPERAILFCSPGDFISLICAFAVCVDRNLK